MIGLGCYKIPQEIKRYLPIGFYKEMKTELDLQFNIDVLERDEVGNYAIWFLGGTYGFHATLERVLKRHGLKFLYDYYDSLDYMDGDCFDDEVSDEIIKIYSANKDV